MMLVLLSVCALTPNFVAGALLRAKGPLDQCGKLPTYENSKPANFKDSMATKFNEKTKKREDVLFKKGDVVDFQCLKGFTTDGSNDAAKNGYKATCSASGYFTTDGVCVKASKCGAVPTIANAVVTADAAKVGDTVIAGAVQFSCSPGYSLDGEKVVAGGNGKNRLFHVKCIEFSGEYEAFAGKCQPYAFVASDESNRIYGDVFEALFTVTCKGKLTKAFGAGKAPEFDATCTKLQAKSTKTKCDDLVKDIKSTFATKKSELEKHSADKEWFDTKGKPGVDAESMKFCKDLYALVKVVNDK